MEYTFGSLGAKFNNIIFDMVKDHEKEDIKEPLVSFKTAKLAKENGILNREIFYENSPYVPFYHKCGDVNYTHPMYSELTGELCYITMPRVAVSSGHISAPTQSLLQRLVRQKLGIHIIVDFIPNKNNVWVYDLIIVEGNILISNKLTFKTYESALDHALGESLQIKKQ